MNCKEFKENILDLFETNIENQELLRHMESCKECKQYYEEWKRTIQLLSPKHAPVLKTTYVNNSAKSRRSIIRSFRSLRQIAALLLIFLLGVIVGLNNFFSSNVTASDTIHLLNQSLINIRNVGNFSMILKVRTEPYENFAYISSDAPFITHYLDVARIGEISIWRLEKENGRTIVCDGEKQYLWSKNYSKASIHSLDAQLGESFTLLTTPELIFEYEKKAVENSPKDSYTVNRTDTTIVLTINEKLKNKVYPLWKNKSLEDSDNIREYTFDKYTGLLTNLRYWMIIDGKKVLIVESQQIHYNNHFNLAEIIQIPTSEHEWVDTRNRPAITPERLKLLQQETPQEAAHRILTAVFNQDTVSAREALIHYDMGKLFESWKAYRLISCKQTFHSSGYYGIGVIAKVINPRKENEKIQIALRNDNPNMIWIVDGGI